MSFQRRQNRFRDLFRGSLRLNCAGKEAYIAATKPVGVYRLSQTQSDRDPNACHGLH